MTKQPRWMKSAIATAKATETQPMPWQRGTARAERLARRDTLRKSLQARSA